MGNMSSLNVVYNEVHSKYSMCVCDLKVVAQINNQPHKHH